MAYPDVIALLRTYLLPIVTPVAVVSRVPDPRPVRLVQIRRVGGTQLRPVRDQSRVDVLAWDDDDPGAWVLAELVRRSVHALARTTLLGPTVYRVQETLGPRQIDDPLTGSPRVMATYLIDVRADDAIAR